MRSESISRLLLALGAAVVAAVATGVARGDGIAALLALIGGVVAALIAWMRPEASPADAVPDPQEPSLASVLDAVADPVLVLTAGRVAIANAAARSVLGTHLVGEDARVAIRHPAAAEALAAAEPRDIELVGLGARDRRWRLVAATGGDMRVVTLHDRTENAAAERMRVDFVANASHELRTPLASIIGYAETLADEAGDDPDLRRRFLRIVGDEARRMQRLVEDLLSLSRIEADKFRVPDQPIDLGRLIDEVCAELVATGNPRSGDLDCVVPGELPAIVGDRAQLSQLLHNLVGNAMKYGRAGTPVTVAAERRGSAVRLTVTDRGEGIAPEHLPRLTERFYRVDAGRSRTLGGTGLGLAICKHIVERHRARMEVQSVPSTGTTVAVTLPAASPPAAPAQAAVIKG
ncbi:sensor histidine kinase [Sphingomonas rubra]|uniref:histidine kinase n=1 Tax=Sphingomonas rubra TaxID=634430 RepID=A0A1I5QQP1_9SPHN|nr:ATP-binding protein [Sphingomonas rubra]SFP48351.1 two-component system, OmpR family, phosphate regulon sensor histidine kinase PhoR [Sphingomonas rubra]